MGVRDVITLWFKFCTKSPKRFLYFSFMSLMFASIAPLTPVVFICCFLRTAYRFWLGSGIAGREVVVYDSEAPYRSFVLFFLINEPDLRAHKCFLSVVVNRGGLKGVPLLALVKARAKAYSLVLVTGLPVVYIRHLNEFIIAYEGCEELGISSLPDRIDFYLCRL